MFMGLAFFPNWIRTDNDIPKDWLRLDVTQLIIKLALCVVTISRPDSIDKNASSTCRSDLQSRIPNACTSVTKSFAITNRSHNNPLAALQTPSIYSYSHPKLITNIPPVKLIWLAKLREQESTIWVQHDQENPVSHNQCISVRGYGSRRAAEQARQAQSGMDQP